MQFLQELSTSHFLFSSLSLVNFEKVAAVVDAVVPNLHPLTHSLSEAIALSGVPLPLSLFLFLETLCLCNCEPP
mgnify:CR=1 FL=1